jgi:ParB family chromosome partitioning protein
MQIADKQNGDGHMTDKPSNEKRKVLGRGLDALLPSRSQSPIVTTGSASVTPMVTRGTGEGSAQEIAVELIDRNPYQTRGRHDEEALRELAASIQVAGVIQPIVVRPTSNGRYQLMAGERRWMASQRAGKQTIPAVVRQASDEQAMEITIIENLQREDLNPMEQARAYDRLSREFGLTQEQIAQRTGKDRPSVANFLRLMKLPAEVQAAMEEGSITFGHGKVLMMLMNEPDQVLAKIARKVLDEGLSVRATEELVRNLLMGPQAGQEKAALRPKDPNVRQAEFELQRALGCRVTIKDKNGRGKIILEYANLEDFDRVLEVISRK